jgi:hypothetical protein
MANQFWRFPVEGGDDGAWAPFADEHLRGAGTGSYSCNLYDDSGDLKISKGKIGINNGTVEGIADIDTVTLISLAAVTNGNWAKIEMTVSGTNVTFSAADTDTGVDTDPSTLPTGFTGGWNGEKQGFYISATKRVIGLAWVNSSGTLEGVINVLQSIEGYMGYSISDDANDNKYSFWKNANDLDEEVTHERMMYVDDSGTKSIVKVYTKVIEIGDWNMDTSTAKTVSHGLDDVEKVISLDVLIRTDSGESQNTKTVLPLIGGNADASYDLPANVGLSPTLVRMQIEGGSFWDSVIFNSTSYNRGWIIIKYRE